MYLIYVYVFDNGKKYIGIAPQKDKKLILSKQIYSHIPVFIQKNFQKTQLINVLIVREYIYGCYTALGYKINYLADFNLLKKDSSYNIDVSKNIKVITNSAIEKIQQELKESNLSLISILFMNNLEFSAKIQHIDLGYLIDKNKKIYEFDFIFQLYMMGLGVKEIQKQVHLSKFTIKKILCFYKIKKPRKTMPINTFLNKNKVPNNNSHSEKKANIPKKQPTIVQEQQNQVTNKPKNNPPLKTSKKIIQYDLNHNFIQEFDSIAQANTSLGKSPSSSCIGDCCNKRQKTAYGYIWEYKN